MKRLAVIIGLASAFMLSAAQGYPSSITEYADLDVNQNAIVTNADAILVQQCVFGVSACAGLTHYDVNQNGAVTNADAILVRQCVFGIYECPVFDEEVIINTGLASSTAMAFDGDDLYIAEKTGAIRTWDGATLGTFTTLAVVSTGEFGLVGIAIDGGYVYVNYTTSTPNIHNRVSRFPLAGGAEQVLIDLDEHGPVGWHAGGALAFYGGKLFVATGDSRLYEVAQDLGSTHGKILRLNPDGSIPPDNPIPGSPVYAYGFRNPFTMAFRADGVLYVNDVGEAAYEEINSVIAGGNYGWPDCEGPCATGEQPIHYYDHQQGRAVTGGLFYPEPPLLGQYIYGDWGHSIVRRLDVSGPKLITTTIAGPVDFDWHDGHVYALSAYGSVYRYTLR
jgi:hypothetical protein